MRIFKIQNEPTLADFELLSEVFESDIKIERISSIYDPKLHKILTDSIESTTAPNERERERERERTLR